MINATILKRSTFAVNRVMEFFTDKELSMQIGINRQYWLLALLKEMVDNGLDACESAGILPEITIDVTDCYLEVRDNGLGLPDDVIKKSLDYMIRITDKALYISPCRGQLGNALKCLYAVPFVLNGERGLVEIESSGKLHRIEITLDRIKQQPIIKHAVTEGSDFVKNGTLIRIFEQAKKYLTQPENGNSYISNAELLLNAYILFNPHSIFQITANGQTIRNQRTSDYIKKWVPGNPTSSYWYSPEKLLSLIVGYVSLEDNGVPAKTVGDFVSEFRWLSGSKKRKEVTDILHMQRTYLHDLVQQDGDIDINAVTRILVAMNYNSAPVKPDLLGDIGKDHFLEKMPYASRESIRYKKATGTTEDSLPYVIEVAFGIKTGDYQEAGSTIICGLNFAPCFSIPIEKLHNILNEAEIDTHDPAVVAVHITCPRFDFTDKGKSKLQLPNEIVDDLKSAIETITKDFTKAKRHANRQGRLRERQIEELRKQEKHKRLSTKEAVSEVMKQAYMKASGNGAFPANARQIMYAARPLVQELTGKAKNWSNSDYFTQILLPDYLDQHPVETETWDVAYDARGKLIEPHTGRRVDLGTLPVRSYYADWHSSISNSGRYQLSHEVKTSGPANRYKFVLFIEKEGFDELLKRSSIAEKYDLAVMSTKGMSVTAARDLIEKLSDQGVTILVLRDLDKAGFSIVHTLKKSGRRYKYNTPPTVIDLGLRLSDAKEMELPAEAVEYDSQKDPRISLLEAGANEIEAEFLRSGGRPKQWTGNRIELNAMTSPQFIDFLEKKLMEAGVEKVIPEGSILKKAFLREHRNTYLQQKLDEAMETYDGNHIEVPDDLSEQIKTKIQNSTQSWDVAIGSIVNTNIKARNDDI
jgi:DNA topoisomerase VI subunit B